MRLGCGRKPLDQGIDACACSPQPGLKGIAFVGELLELLLQIAVVLLQGVVARQQALYARSVICSMCGEDVMARKFY